jgi:hypothetical protein
MKRLELDFVRPPAPPAWAGWALVAIGLAFVADLGVSYQSLRADVTAKRAQLSRPAATAPRADLVRVSSPPASPEEIAHAREAVKRLATPWNDLFRALESAQSDKVALLSVEPDAESGSVSITGAAKTYLAALSYVASLSAQEPFARVYLAKHETWQDDPQRPVVFTVTASWRPRR